MQTSALNLAISLAPTPHAARCLRLCTDETFVAFWAELNRCLARKQEAEAILSDAVYLFDLGETAEGAAEDIEGQRWLAATA